MEMLEHRLVLSTFWVTNTGDSGAGSLRDAIVLANANAGPDTIEFNIPTSDPGFADGAFVIQPLSALPALSDTTGGTTIDGATQTAIDDSNPLGPEIVLDGGSTGGLWDSGLGLVSDDNQVHGLNIRNFSQYGVWITGDAATITGDYIGTDATGTVAMGNVGAGIRLDHAANTVIGGTTQAERNVVAANGTHGIWVRDLSSDTSIRGNFLGTDASGTVALGNYNTTIYVDNSPNTIIGGSEPGAGNVISGSQAGHGIAIAGDSPSTLIQGNLIGTDVTGTLDLGNHHDGICVGSRFDTAFPSGTQIGGTDPQGRNIISNNANGITITYGGGNVIQGNYIGTDATGTQNMGNPGRGIRLNNSSDNLIGGNLPGSGNLISGDASHRGLIAIEYEQSTGNKIQGNYIGVDVTGTYALGNCITGIRVDWGAGDTLIGADGDGEADDLEGNLVAGIGGSSYSMAIRLNGDDNVVAGNLIGTNSSGTVAIPNYRGVGVCGSNNRIGTNGDGVSDQLERNIVDSIEVNGVFLEDGAQHNVIAGNYIGTDITGTERLGSGGSAFNILFNYAHNNRIGTDADGVSDVLERNVIGSSNHAVHIANSTGNVVAGNFIGVGADGITPVSEAEVGGVGILLQSGAFANRIGGATEVERNVISGNEWTGVTIGGLGCEENVVQGNYIGVDALGNPLGNHMHGVLLIGTARNLIGGTQPGEGNVIANNLGSGVVVGDDAQGNTIRGNSIYGNGGLGIDLGQDGVTPNDDLDGDTGANNLQNFPVISRVESGPTTRAVGTFNSAAGTTFKFDFYANSEADPSGFGEGERWLGWAEVITDSEGNANFNEVLEAATASGEVITATATAPDGSTSEFSGADVVARPPVLIDVMPGSDLNPINLAQNGVIPVAILTTDSFDASWVNASTVVFAGASAVHSALEDVDGDGDLDMILHFDIHETNLAELYAQLVAEDLDGDGTLDSNHKTAAVSLTGLTAADEYFEGFDEVDLFLTGKNLRDFLEDLAAVGAI